MHRDEAPPADAPALATGTLAGLAIATVALHFALTGRYGIFRDELYYLACADHLDQELVGELRREGPPTDSAPDRVRPTPRMYCMYLPGLAGPEAARSGQWAA